MENLWSSYYFNKKKVSIYQHAFMSCTDNLFPASILFYFFIFLHQQFVYWCTQNSPVVEYLL